MGLERPITMTRELATLRDALNNFRTDSGANDEYCKGLLVGVVSGLMARGMSFANAIKYVSDNMPRQKGRTLTYANVPESWLQDLQKVKL